MVGNDLIGGELHCLIYEGDMVSPHKSNGSKNECQNTQQDNSKEQVFNV